MGFQGDIYCLNNVNGGVGGYGSRGIPLAPDRVVAQSSPTICWIGRA